jgi:hypothetical protein
MRLTHIRTPWQSRTAGRHPRRLSAAAIAVALAAFLLTAGVAFAQSSAGYDLACRGAFTSNGGLLTAPSNTYGMVSAFGQSPAGESKSPNYGIHGGYVQPGAAAVTARADAVANPAQTSRNLLPFIGRVVRVVRGGC